MAKTKINIGDLIDDFTNDMSVDAVQKPIPDIMTFVNNKEWLGLPTHPTNPIKLFNMQRIMLKTFYRGSLGNENLMLTEDEIKMCEDLGLKDDSRGDVIGKYNSGELFRELVLVWGRRSGKDFIVSIIALYEAMKLLECPGGDPYAMYELSSATPINILTVANAKPQAKIAFDEIKEKLLYSEYFRDKFVKDGMTTSSIYLLTPQDKRDNKEFREKGLPQKKGSIGIVVGHSNSDSLLGMGCIVLILDEVASYKTSGGSSSGDRIYTALTPTVSTYNRKTYLKDGDNNFIYDEHGQKIIQNRVYDGKIISISSPRAQEGIFYEMFRDAHQVDQRLAMRLPTWDVNTQHTREALRKESPLGETDFNMEFGAEFSGMGLESFFTEDLVNSCFTGHNFKDIDVGLANNVHFVHIDPASSSHNYALVVLHKEYFMDPETKKAQFVIIVDHIKHWSPAKGPINPEEVTGYILSLKRRFHIGLLTYDSWASQESIRLMRKAGIPNKETKFTGPYKMKIYREFENLVLSGRIKIPAVDSDKTSLLRSEMIELQRKFTANGFKIMPKTDGDGVKSDDIVDCVAGAAYIAIEKQVNRLPNLMLVECGNPGIGGQVWKRGNSIMGVGSGPKVARDFEQRNNKLWYGRR